MKRQRFQVVGSAALIVVAVASFNLMGTPSQVSAQAALYKSCAEYKLTAPLAAAANATQAATAAVTMAATQASTPSAVATTSADSIVFLSIVGTDSEACYLASETFLQGNPMNLPAGFNGAVGVTKTIKGDIALDRANVANSQIGDITINISEFKSDNDRRDGFIRQRFLESNKYPYATLTNVSALGLPSGAYQDGSLLKFQIKGTLTVHDTKRETVFDATGSFTGGTLVITAITDLKMSELGVTPPDLGGILKVDDALRLVINIVAREAKAAATPAK